MSDSPSTAAILVIGNEILSGRTQDANTRAIAKKLGAVGVRLREVRVVADIERDIIEALDALRRKFDYVFTTGGIGPTHDDITAETVAKAFGVPLIEHPEARNSLMDYYTAEGLTDARLRMARVPQGASLILNPISAAPGFHIDNVFVMAGVPAVMQAMMDQVAAQLRHGPAFLSIAVSGHVKESQIAAELRKLAEHYPQLDLGSYPWFKNERFGVSLVARGTDHAGVEAAARDIFALLERHGGEPVGETHGE
ncbi:MAG: competence/damage-inducible protein A [Bdellovibrionales bacterium]